MDYFMLNKMAVCIMLMQRPGKPPFSKKKYLFSISTMWNDLICNNWCLSVSISSG